MKDLICIICGKDAWKNNLCRKHFLKRERLLDIKGFSLKVCRNCGSYYDGRWIKGSLEKALIDMVRGKIPSKIKAKIVSARKGNRVQLRISATAKIAGAEKREEKILNVFLKKKLCENCIKLSGGYYEAMLQIRGKNSERIFEMIEKDVKSEYTVGMDKTKNGYDIRLLKKDSARKLVKALTGYKIKKSYKHVTTKKGRMIYRDYYSIR